MTMGVIARRVVDEEQAGLGSPGIDELRWKKPVYPGDVVIIEARVLRLRSRMGLLKGAARVDAYPFSPESAAPRISSRWSSKNNTSTGNVASTATARSWPYSGTR